MYNLNESFHSLLQAELEARYPLLSYFASSQYYDVASDYKILEEDISDNEYWERNITFILLMVEAEGI